MLGATTITMGWWLFFLCSVLYFLPAQHLLRQLSHNQNSAFQQSHMQQMSNLHEMVHYHRMPGAVGIVTSIKQKLSSVLYTKVWPYKLCILTCLRSSAFCSLSLMSSSDREMRLLLGGDTGRRGLLLDAGFRMTSKARLPDFLMGLSAVHNQHHSLLLITQLCHTNRCSREHNYITPSWQ